MILVAILSAFLLTAQASDWKLGGYQKGFELKISSGKTLSKHHELPRHLDLGYLSEITTRELGALIVGGQDNQDKVWVAPDTKVMTLTQNESGRVKLESGSLRVQANVTIQTEIGDCQFEASQDIVISWSPKALEIRLWVLEGQIKIPCFDFDKPLELSKGQAASFIADKVAGAPVFDLLPSGRKMPRGVVREDQEIVKELNFDWTGLEKAIKKQATPPPPPKKKVVVRLCNNPSADFGQCRRIKASSGLCSQSRCSAQGTWEYETELGLEVECTPQGQIVPCN